MKKLVSMALALSLCLAMFAGCGGTPSSSSTVSSGPSSSSEDTSTSGFENKEVNIAIFEGGYGPEYWEEIVDRFEETYGVTVNMQISPTIGDIIRPQIVAGNVPDFISMNDNDTTGLISSMIRENALLAITDVVEGPGLEDTSPLKEQVLEGVLNTAKCSPYSDGKVYLAPFNASPMGLVYNKTLFEENGWELPETWDEFFALGDKAKEKGIALFTYAGIHPGYMESLLWPAIASAAGIDTTTDISNYVEGSFSSPEVMEVLANIQKIAADGYLMEGTVALNHTQSQTDIRFLYTEESVKLFAEKAGGIYALKNATEWSKDYVTEGVYSMNDVYNMGDSMVFGFAALPEGSKVTPRDEVFQSVADVMNGAMTPEQWAEKVEASFTEVSNMAK